MREKAFTAQVQPCVLSGTRSDDLDGCKERGAGADRRYVGDDLNRNFEPEKPESTRRQIVNRSETSLNVRAQANHASHRLRWVQEVIQTTDATEERA
jgi:hypothetical protein